MTFQQKDRKSKKMLNGKVRYKKHEIDNAFDVPISRPNTAKERVMNLKMDKYKSSWKIITILL